MRAAESFALRFTSINLKELYITKVGIDPTPGLDKIGGSKFEESLDENIEVILRKARNCTYRFTSYRQKLFSKGKDSKPREICMPTVRDKLTLSALSQILDDVYGAKCVTPQPQHLVDAVRQQMQKGPFDAFVKIDVSGFYSSIDHEKLMRAIRRRIRKPEVLHLIEAAIRTPSSTYGSKTISAREKGVPEGLSVSNKLANIYVLDIDTAFKERSDCAYFRYVDDVLILCKASDIEKMKHVIKRTIGKLGLSLNQKKCREGLLASDEFGYLGYVFEPNGEITVRRSSILNIEQALESMFRQFEKDKPAHWHWKLNLRITGCRIEDDEGLFERYGWLHYFSRINNVKLLCHLDWMVNKFFIKYSIERPDDLKYFRKAFYELTFNASSTKYIPTFSPNTPLETKRRMLSEVFSELDVESMDDKEVSRLFSKRTRREARRLERDIGRLS